MRALRTLFGWKPSTVRADLKDILDVMSPGESGFSPEESRMLKNILGLRERRVGDVRVPRADIQPSSGTSTSASWCAFSSASSQGSLSQVTRRRPHRHGAHPGLIAHDQRGRSRPEKTPSAKPLPAGLDLKGNLAMPLSATKIVREIALHRRCA